MSQRLAAAGIAIIAIVIAIYAFVQQQGAAQHEATAVANAQVAVAQMNTQATGQAQAEEAQQTAVAQMNAQATGQAQAEEAQQTAVAQMNTAATAQAQAEATRAAAEQSEQAAVATAGAAVAEATQQAGVAAQAQAEATQQANAAAQAQAEATQQANAAAQAQAEATQQAAIVAQVQTEIARQAATATAVQQANLEQAATAAYQSTQSAAAFSATQSSGATQAAELVATAVAAQTQIAHVELTATSAYEVAQATLSNLQAVAAVPVAPGDVIHFLNQQGIVPENTGYLAFQLGETTIDMSGKKNRIRWDAFAGTYSDFVVGSTISWGKGEDTDSCNYLFRNVDDDNHYIIGIDRTGAVSFDARIDAEWEGKTPYTSTPLIHTNPDDTNQMVLVGIGNTFTLYLNGQLAVTYTHSGFSAGGIAAAAGSDNGLKGAGCTFDNSWVWDLSRPSVSATVAPTLRPTLEPTVEPTIDAAANTDAPYPVPTLTAKFTSADGSITLNYPRSWQTQDDQGIVWLYSSAAAADTSSSIRSGDVVMFVSHFPGSADDLDSQIQLLTKGLSQNDTNQNPLSFGHPQSFTLAGHQARRAYSTNAGGDSEVIVYEDFGEIVIMGVLTAPEEVLLWEPTITAIAKTITVKERPL